MLEKVDLSVKITEKEYQHDVPLLQAQLRELAHQLYIRRRQMVAVYEGWDAAGKGGNIRRVTQRLDPRGYEVFAISAPTGEDKTHHYLWRFWRRLRPAEEKQVLIFDRSWYGRVMVERVEGFATEAEWKRAYREMNNFERQISDSGAIIVKFWLHISPEEQLKRFKERQEKPYKSWKLTGEDWRNRDKWPQYLAAAEEMLVKTSTIQAPWAIIEGNYKWHARVKCLRILVERLSRELNYKPRIHQMVERP